MEDDVSQSGETGYAEEYRCWMTVDIPLHEVFYIQPDIAYSQKANRGGGIFKNDGGDEEILEDYNSISLDTSTHQNYYSLH